MNAEYSLNELKNNGRAVEIYHDRLYFASFPIQPLNNDEITYITISSDVEYVPYFADFGPFNLSQLITFCRIIRDELVKASLDASPFSNDYQTKNDNVSEVTSSSNFNPKKIVVYSSLKTYERVNIACLVGGFAIIVLGYSPEYVDQLFSSSYPPFISFRDSSYNVTINDLTLLDVWKGLKKGLDLNWITMETESDNYYSNKNDTINNISVSSSVFSTTLSTPDTNKNIKKSLNGENINNFSLKNKQKDNNLKNLNLDYFKMYDKDPLKVSILNSSKVIDNFDIFKYNFFDAPENGGLNWIIPGKLLAFASPDDTVAGREAINYVPMFRWELNVKQVIRLNDPSIYNSLAFKNQSIKHDDLYFPDGSIPSDSIIIKFLKIVKNQFYNNNHKIKCFETQNNIKKDINFCNDNIKRNKLYLSLCNAHLILNRNSFENTIIDGGIIKVNNLLDSVDNYKSNDGKIGIIHLKSREQRNKGGAVAVHCLAGLGRTGFLIGAFLIVQFGFTGREAVGWIRLCRPGSIMSVQQNYLEKFEKRWKKTFQNSHNIINSFNINFSKGNDLVNLPLPPAHRQKYLDYRYLPKHERFFLELNKKTFENSDNENSVDSNNTILDKGVKELDFDINNEENECSNKSIKKTNKIRRRSASVLNISFPDITDKCSYKNNNLFSQKKYLNQQKESSISEVATINSIFDSDNKSTKALNAALLMST